MTETVPPKSDYSLPAVPQTASKYRKHEEIQQKKKLPIAPIVLICLLIIVAVATQKDKIWQDKKTIEINVSYYNDTRYFENLTRTNSSTPQEIDGGIQILTLIGINGLDGSLENYEMLIKLTAGSADVAFNDTRVTFDTKTSTQNLRYSGVYGKGIESSSSYSVEYLKNGTAHLTDYLIRGDIVRLRFNSTNNIYNGTTVKLRIIPKHGPNIPLDVVTPDDISKEKVTLYPIISGKRIY